MKNNYLFILIAIIGLASCETIVDVKVNEVDPYLVVDAWLSRTPEDQVIRLTTTQPYFDNSFTPGVTGADVKLTDGSGNEFVFVDQGDGNYAYVTTDSFGVVGQTYFLEILWEGNTYSSSATLSRKVTIDSLVYNTLDPDEPEEDYYAEFFGRDPDGVGDAYWLKAYKNGKYLNKPSEIYTFDDESFSNDNGEGLPFIFPIRTLPNSFEDDINRNDLPLYRFEERFNVNGNQIADFYGSRAVIEGDQLRIVFDDSNGFDPLSGGVEYIPLDSAPYYVRYSSISGTTQAVEVIKKPDSLYLELHTISTDAYFFLARLQQETDRPSGFGALFSTPPSDLPTNIICSDPEVPVVGFFNISSVSTLGQTLTTEVARIDD